MKKSEYDRLPDRKHKDKNFGEIKKEIYWKLEMIADCLDEHKYMYAKGITQKDLTKEQKKKIEEILKKVRI